MKFLVMLALVLASVPAFAKKQPSVRTPASGDKWTCGGTEPFWGLMINGKKVTFEDPVDNSKVSMSVSQKINPVGSTAEGYGFAMRVNEGKQENLITIRRNECNDGMSERKWSHELMMVRGDRLFIGCCDNK